MSDKPESVAEGACPNCRDCDCAETHVAEAAALRKAEEERDAAIRAVEAAKIMDQEHFSSDEGANDRWLDAVQRFRAALASAPQEKCSVCGYTYRIKDGICTHCLSAQDAPQEKSGLAIEGEK
jgi:hypothetical protein